MLKASTDNVSLAVWIFVCQTGSEGPSLPIREASAPPTRALLLLLPTPAPCPRPESAGQHWLCVSAGGGEQEKHQEVMAAPVLARGRKAGSRIHPMCSGTGPFSPAQGSRSAACAEQAACTGSSPARAGRARGQRGNESGPRVSWQGSAGSEIYDVLPA